MMSNDFRKFRHKRKQEVIRGDKVSTNMLYKMYVVSKYELIAQAAHEESPNYHHYNFWKNRLIDAYKTEGKTDEADELKNEDIKAEIKKEINKWIDG